jgi:hypothetical protein
MHDFLIWLEATTLSVWVRESTSVWAFPAILSAHAIGMGLAVGVNAAIALHLLGVGRAIPTRELRVFVPVMWFGFWLNAASGVLLFIGYPTKALTNPVFSLKLLLIAAGLWIFTVLRARLFDATGGVGAATPTPASMRDLSGWAVACLVCWASAITAGRLLAYTYTQLLADWTP